MNNSLLLILLCIPMVLLTPYTRNRAPVGETTEEGVNNSPPIEETNGDDVTSGEGAPEGSGSGKEVIKEADEDNDDTDHPDKDLFDVNMEVEEKLGDIIKDETKPGWHVSQGDIMFRECEEEEIFGVTNMPNPKCEKKKRKSSRRDATIRANSKWPLPVPYNIVGLGKKAKGVIQEAFDEFKLKTCIKFRQKTATDSNHVKFYKGDGCNSVVGRYLGDSEHGISLDDGCYTKNTAIHEIMHALGFYHEQSRGDRDNFVTINWDNIDLTQHKKTVNFGMELTDVTTYGFDYDYRSTMHYSKTEFGKKNWLGVKKETITPTQNTDLGQCNSCGFSRIDALQLNARYCNEAKDVIDRTTLTEEIKRWMAIYNGDSNDDFRKTLLDHLKVIYPSYYFTVSSYDAVGGYDKHAFVGHCSYVWRYYSRNQVVCYSKKVGPRFPSQSKQETIMREVVNQVKNRGCDAKTIRDTADPLVEAYGYTYVGVHAVIHGNGLRSRWNGYTQFENFNCSNDNKASLVVMFGDI